MVYVLGASGCDGWTTAEDVSCLGCVALHVSLPSLWKGADARTMDAQAQGVPARWLGCLPTSELILTLGALVVLVICTVFWAVSLHACIGSHV